MNVNLSQKHNENFLKYYFHPKELAVQWIQSIYSISCVFSGNQTCELNVANDIFQVKEQ